MYLRLYDIVELADGSRGKVVDLFKENGIEKCQIKRENENYDIINKSDIAYRLVHPSKVCPVCGGEKDPCDDRCEECIEEARKLK